MPWKVEDVERHKKGLTDHQKETWVKVANSAFASCQKAGREDCDASAIRQANSVVEKNMTFEEFKAEQTFNIEKVEIFSVGKWNGDVYTQDDLDAMVAAFDKVGFQPPLKLGHNKEQEREIHRDGQPALGWVERLTTKGGKLLADFSHVPQKLYEAIKRKNYTTISSEIYMNFDFNGKEFSKVLRAVSLLGADIPAVGGLEQIVDLYTKEGDHASSEDYKFYTTKEENLNEEAEKMEKEELERKLTEEKKAKEAAEKALKKAEDEKALSIKDTEKAKAELAKVQAEATLKETDTLIETLKKEGKIIPAFEEEAKALLMSASNTKCFTYSHEGKTVELSQRETVIRFFNALGKQVDFGEKGKAGGSAGDDDYTNRKEAGDELHKRATELMEKDSNIKTYSDAQTKVLNADSDLKAAYAGTASK